MKKLSITKLIAALLIANCYVFTCGVMGEVGGSAIVRDTESDDSENIGEADGQGTMDFLVPDETATGYVQLDLLNITPVPLSGKAVQSTYSVSSSVQDIPEELPQTDTEEILGRTEEYEPATDEIYIAPPETEAATASTKKPKPSTTKTTKASTQTTPVVTESTPNGIPVENTSSAVTTGGNPEAGGNQEATPSDDDHMDELAPTEEGAAYNASDSTSVPEATLATGISDAADVGSEILYVTSNGGTVSGTALDIISRITQNEVGHTFAPEAIKAQAVASYTYVKFCNEYGTYPSVGLASTVSDSVSVLVGSVIGKAIYYNDSLIQAVYSASSAGYTASSKSVWGTDYPYLVSRFCDLDKSYDPNYGREVRYSSDDIKNRVLENTGIGLSGDPSGWLSVEDRVDGNYVAQMSVGGYHSYTASDGESVKLTGRVFREKIMGFELRSSAFDVEYDADSDEFVFTTYGYGHGVGMSQNGANALATYLGYDYKDILTYYYQGTEVK